METARRNHRNHGNRRQIMETMENNGNRKQNLKPQNNTQKTMKTAQ
jgi:hypothetical protein